MDNTLLDYSLLPAFKLSNDQLLEIVRKRNESLEPPYPGWSPNQNIERLSKKAFATFKSTVPSSDDIAMRALGQAVNLIGPMVDNQNASLILDTAWLKATEFQRECELRAVCAVERSFFSVCKSQETLANFVRSLNGRVIQSRKPGAGSALEIMLSSIFTYCGISFDRQYGKKIITGNPDFVFPSVKSYLNNPRSSGVMPVKTTCHQRQFMVFREAKDAGIRMFFTLDRALTMETVSAMRGEGIIIVTTDSVRNHLNHPFVLSLEEAMDILLDKFASFPNRRPQIAIQSRVKYAEDNIRRVQSVIRECERPSLFEL